MGGVLSGFSKSHCPYCIEDNYCHCVFFRDWVSRVTIKDHEFQPMQIRTRYLDVSGSGNGHEMEPVTEARYKYPNFSLYFHSSHSMLLQSIDLDGTLKNKQKSPDVDSGL